MTLEDLIDVLTTLPQDATLTDLALTRIISWRMSWAWSRAERRRMSVRWTEEEYARYLHNASGVRAPIAGAPAWPPWRRLAGEAVTLQAISYLDSTTHGPKAIPISRLRESGAAPLHGGTEAEDGQRDPGATAWLTALAGCTGVVAECGDHQRLTLSSDSSEALGFEEQQLAQDEQRSVSMLAAIIQVAGRFCRASVQSAQGRSCDEFVKLAAQGFPESRKTASAWARGMLALVRRVINWSVSKATGIGGSFHGAGVGVRRFPLSCCWSAHGVSTRTSCPLMLRSSPCEAFFQGRQDVRRDTHQDFLVGVILHARLSHNISSCY